MGIETVFEQMWRGRTVGPAFLIAAASDVAIGIGLIVAAVVGTDSTTAALILGAVGLVMVAFGAVMGVAVLRLMRSQSGGGGSSRLVTLGDGDGG